MKSLVIGNGQVGSGLYEVIKEVHETHVKDLEELNIDGVEILHLCFPYSEKFIELANAYIEKYKPKLTINHASVPVGTTDKLLGLKCYSPIRGKHPKLAKGIKTFDKFIAGTKEATDIASTYFKQCSMTTLCYSEHYINSLEYCKLMSNIRYGSEICFMQEAERIAKRLDVDIEVFKMFEESYNKGYRDMGEYNMVRPILYGGFIGGHCVMQNIDVIETQTHSELFDWMKFSNFKKRVEIEKEK